MHPVSPILAVAAIVAITAAPAGCDHSPGSAPIAPNGPDWFTEITEEAGLDVGHDAGAKGRHWLPEIMGPGVALLDHDGDGDLDCYLVDGNDSLPEGGPTSGRRNKRLRREADGTYVDVTVESGLGDDGYGMGLPSATSTTTATPTST